MNSNKGFSLAEILQTIFVVGIIAGISLGFFRHHEPDRRIYDSTVRQLEFAVAAVTHKACSDEYICIDTTNNTASAPSCPQYNSLDVPFKDNKCEVTNSANCNGDWTENIDSSKCIAHPKCNGENAGRYRDTYCATNGVPELNKKITRGGVTTTFFCDQMYGLLSNSSNPSKESICNELNVNLPLPNRARLYGLTSHNSGPGMKMQGGAGADDPAYLVIKYDSIKNNTLFGSDDMKSLSEDTAGAVFVFPNGWLVSMEKYLEGDGNGHSGSKVFFNDNYFHKNLFFSGSYTKDQNTYYRSNVINDVKTVCGDKGVNCSHATGKNIFKTFDAAKQLGTSANYN